MLKTDVQNVNKVIFGENAKTDGRFMIAARGFISTQVLVATQVINIYHTYVMNGKTVSKNKSTGQYDKTLCKEFVTVKDTVIPCDIT